MNEEDKEEKNTNKSFLLNSIAYRNINIKENVFVLPSKEKMYVTNLLISQNILKFEESKTFYFKKENKLNLVINHIISTKISKFGLKSNNIYILNNNEVTNIKLNITRKNSSNYNLRIEDNIIQSNETDRTNIIIKNNNINKNVVKN